MILHENIDEFVNIHTQNTFEQNHLYQLEQMRTDIGGSLKYVGELEPISKKYFSDGPGVSMLPVNADDKVSFVSYVVMFLSNANLFPLNGFSFSFIAFYPTVYFYHFA